MRTARICLLACLLVGTDEECSTEQLDKYRY